MNYSDRPIQNKEGDKLGRSHFASMCAKAIVNLSVEETFTIGLYGKWGSGKTSLINMMVNEIETLNDSNQDVSRMHIIRFEPWVFTDSSQLMSQFFIHLATQLRGKPAGAFDKIGEKLEEYAWLWQAGKMVPWEFIVPVLGQGARDMADGAQEFTEKLGRKMRGEIMSADILTQKKAIVSLLEQQKDRILIVIDDIDRLSNDQIRQVFQLVTAIANFPNITYLLSFDKEIVVKALAEVQKGDGDEYLGKIVQMPISLPDVQREDVRTMLYQRLRAIQQFYTADRFDDNDWALNYEYFFAPFVKNIRDMNRLCNAVIFKYGALAYDVYFMDMVALTVLELFSPVAYEWVKNHREMLLNSWEDCHSLMARFDDWDTEDELADVLGANESKERVDEIIQLIIRLFPNYKAKKNKNVFRHSYDSNRVLSTHRIGVRLNFDRYFHLDIHRLVITEEQATYYLNKANIEELVTFFLKIEGTDTYYFLDIFLENESQLTLERIECYIRALIQASHHYRILKKWDVSQLIFDSLRQSDKKERVFVNIFSSVAWEDITVLALLLYWYSPKRKRQAVFFDDNEFVRIQTTFLERMKTLLWEKRIFDVYLSDLVFGVVNDADSAYATESCKNLCEKDDNIINLVDWIVQENYLASRHTEKTVWEMKNFYSFITAEQICDAITRQKEINAIPSHLAEKCEFFLEHSSDYKEPPSSDEEK